MILGTSRRLGGEIWNGDEWVERLVVQTHLKGSGIIYVISWQTVS